jgi:hypothetical protein
VKPPLAGLGLGRPYDDRHAHRPGNSDKKGLVAFTAVVGALAVGLWALNTWAGRHIKECGFDSHGVPYAVVRDNALGGAKHEEVTVRFHYHHRWHEPKKTFTRSVYLPTVFGHAMGGVTTVVHGTWPKLQPNGPQKVYCTVGGSGINDYN